MLFSQRMMRVVQVYGCCVCGPRYLCREFYRVVLPDIEREYIATGKIKLTFVNLPIPQLHPNSPAAHEFAMCAAEQDKFWPVHDLLYQHQAAWSPLESPRELFTIFADSAGLDLEALDGCFDTGATRWIVEQEAQSVAQQANITSTPSFMDSSVALRTDSLSKSASSACLRSLISRFSHSLAFTRSWVLSSTRFSRRS